MSSRLYRISSRIFGFRNAGRAGTHGFGCVAEALRISGQRGGCLQRWGHRFWKDTMQRAYWLIASVVIAGCTAGTPPTPNTTDGAPPPPRATDVGTPSGNPVEKTIGAAGGTVASADGLLTMDVPAGALGADTQLGVQPLTGTAPNGLGPGFRLTSGGATFSSPVKLTFKPSADQLAGTVLALTGIGFQDASGFWHWARGVERDEASGSVSVTTTHFSDWSLLAGVQLRPPSASVRIGDTLTLTVIDCYTEEEELAPLPVVPGEEELAPLPGPRFDCDPSGEQLAPLPLKLSNWSVNGIGGGNSTVGTVSAGADYSATYTAPSMRPDPSTVAASVEASKVKLDGRTFAKATLVSNVSIVGEIETYRGTFQLSWQETDTTGTRSINASGTLEFGPVNRLQDQLDLLNLAQPGMALNIASSQNSTVQFSNFNSTPVSPDGETCTAAGPGDGQVVSAYLHIRTSPNEHALSLTLAGMLPGTCNSPQYSSPREASLGVIGMEISDDRNPDECLDAKFVPSPADRRNLNGSASWNCFDSGNSRTVTVTLTWNLTGS